MCDQIQGRFHGKMILCKHIFNNISCSEAYKLISFKLSMMLHTSKVYSNVLVWMALTVVKGHKIMRKQNVLQSLFSVACRQSNYAIVDNAREIITKKSCKYGELDHLSICCFY